jgi:hypothetical protein
MYGFDINPLAVLISRVKFTKLSINEILDNKTKLRENVFEFIKDEQNIDTLPLPTLTNSSYWFSNEVLQNLNILRKFIFSIENEALRNFFLVPFSETVREASFTRNNEFKLFRMKSEDILKFNPDVLGIYFKKLNDTIYTYTNIYFPKLTEDMKICIKHANFDFTENFYDVVLTSPPYGDSRTTVAYGQFSTLSNEWLGIEYARKIDGMLMGGVKAKTLYSNGLMHDYIQEVHKADAKRALEVSSFYIDLENSIKKVANSIKKGGKSIYVVGNRTVKNIQLPTDQFIAEKFEENGLQHIITYERSITSKSMPSQNSPTNKTGKKVNTMLFEYIVVCEKP